MKPKILVIGIDGGTFTFIDKLIKQDKLPNIKKIIKTGVRSDLLSTIQPSSEQAWPAFATGVNNGKHDIFGLLKFDNDYSSRLIDGLDQKACTLWEILSRYNKKIVLINMPLTYPPQKINGLIVAGYLTPGKSSNYTFPKQLKKEIENEVPDYVIDTPSLEFTFDNKKRLDTFLEKNFQIIELRYKLADYLLRKYEWDCSIIIFSTLDSVQHKFWSYDNPDYKDVINNFYMSLDEKIGELISHHNPDYLFLVSDHGFTRLKYEVFLNIWLNKTGFLKFKEGFTKNKRFTDYLLKAAHFLTKKFPINKQLVVSKFPLLNKFISSFLYKDIDWENTKAFVVGSGNIRINLQGRESRGRVAVEDYEQTRDDIIKAIKRLKDPISNEKLYQEIFKREEIYKGPYLQNAPDIIILFKGEYKPSLFIGDKNKIFSDSLRSYITGNHHMRGIFIANGLNIKKNVKLKHANLIDVAPTLLHILDIPVPADMDGKILDNIFTKTLNRKKMGRNKKI